MKSAILAGLSKKNQTLINDGVLSFENIQITGSPAYPLAVGTYSYTFDVRAKKDLKIGFTDAETTAAQVILEGQTGSFNAVNKVEVKEISCSRNRQKLFSRLNLRL